MLVALREMDCATVSALQEKVIHDPAAFAQLLQYLTIPVTEMFRDPEYYAAVRTQVVPFLRTYPSLKIWVAGCSTGEEVYSLAILLHEEGLLERSLVYATDINPESLDAARRGVFPLDRMRLYTENYQKAGGTRAFSDYYTAAYGGARFDRALVENVTFADHSLATDSVFSETHFISCRNVMIYFNRRLQDRVLGLFHESLCHRGFLGMGSKESIEFSRYAERFEPLAKRERVFRKVGA
jgi:chemotaxis protein methyltransferase CheR